MDKTTNRTHIRLINKVLKSTGAQNETRTHTPLPALPPQSSVYTNFTTCAYCARNRGRTCTLLSTLVPETSASANFAIRASYLFNYQQVASCRAFQYLSQIILLISGCKDNFFFRLNPIFIYFSL